MKRKLFTPSRKCVYFLLLVNSSFTEVELLILQDRRTLLVSKDSKSSLSQPTTLLPRTSIWSNVRHQPTIFSFLYRIYSSNVTALPIIWMLHSPNQLVENIRHLSSIHCIKMLTATSTKVKIPLQIRGCCPGYKLHLMVTLHFNSSEVYGVPLYFYYSQDYWSEKVLFVKVPSMGEIDLIENYLY